MPAARTDFPNHWLMPFSEPGAPYAVTRSVRRLGKLASAARRYLGHLAADQASIDAAGTAPLEDLECEALSGATAPMLAEHGPLGVRPRLVPSNLTFRRSVASATFSAIRAGSTCESPPPATLTVDFSGDIPLWGLENIVPDVADALALEAASFPSYMVGGEFSVRFIRASGTGNITIQDKWRHR